MGRGIGRQIDRLSAGAIAVVNSPRPLLWRLVTTLAIWLMLCCCLDACGGSSSATQARTLTAITIDVVDASIAVGTTVQLHATGAFSDGTTEELTASVSWSSANTSVAPVNDSAGSKGLVTGASVGVTTITATRDGKTGVTAFTVTQADLTSITVEPVNPQVAKGTTVQMAAQGNFSDGSVQELTTQVSWSSANSSIAQVSNTAGTMGLVTGVSVGNTAITATLGGVQGSTTVNVTAATLTAITITVPVDTIAKGTTVQETATCNFSDGTTEDCTNEDSWTSGDSGIAQVSDAAPTKGLVTGVGVGNTTIFASFAGITGSAAVTVSAATLTSITITPPNPVLAKGTGLQLTATGDFSDGTTEDLTTQASWTSGDNAIAQVSDVLGRQGLLTVLSTGSTSISATLKGIHGSTTVTVTAPTLTALTITPPGPSIAKGTALQLTATGDFSDGSTEDLTTQVSWTSGDNAIAQVADAAGTNGLVTGVGVGNTTISGSFAGVQGSATVTVTAATLTSITITPPNPVLAKGTALQLTATGDFSDGSTEDLTTQVSWTSGNNGIAQVSNVVGTNGLVAGVSVGSTAITATLAGVAGSTTATVTAAALTSLAITPPNPVLAKSTALQLTATGDFSDGSTEDLTTQVSWTSGNDLIAQVSNVLGKQGLLTALATGSTSIRATLNGIHSSITVTVTAPTLTALILTPPGPSIAKGTALQLTATGDFSDGTTENLTTQVSWTSGNNAIAQVSNVAGTNGLVTGVSVGSTPITATLGDVHASTMVTVTTAVLTSIQITPPNPSVAKGTTQQLTATGMFSDGTTEDLTNTVSWSASPGNLATVNPAGLLTGTNVGAGLVRATLVQGGGVTIEGITTFTVTPAVLISITITPPIATVVKDTTIQLTAIGNFSDGSTQDLTTSVSWSSAGFFTATVNAKGLVTGVRAGSTLVFARREGKSKGIFVRVTPGAVTSITIDPVNPTTTVGSKEIIFTAIGTFSDGSTQNVTQLTSWISSDPTVATVLSSVPPSTGELLPLMSGTTTITATFGGVKDSTLVTVGP
jgi:trimeric autotransporter adhesin